MATRTPTPTRRNFSERLDLALIWSGKMIKPAAAILAVCGLIAAWVLGVPRLEAYASGRLRSGGPAQAEGREAPFTVRFVSLPAWAHGDLEATLLQRAAALLGPDPLRRDDLVAVRQSLLATGWFEQIAQVRRPREGLVEIDARFAEPVAVVRDKEGRLDYLVDSRGWLLPGSFPAGEAAGLVVVIGVRADQPASAGRPWQGQDLAAALSVLRLLRTRPWVDQVARIEVTHEAQELHLISDRGCTIIWGRPPGMPHAGEVTPSRKLQYLDYHHRQYGHIDRSMGELDIRGDVVIGR